MESIKLGKWKVKKRNVKLYNNLLFSSTKNNKERLSTNEIDDL